MNKIILNSSLALLFILSSLKFYQSYDNVFFESFKRYGGEEIAVYPEVLEIRNLLEKYEIMDFNVSLDIMHRQAYQRIAEFTYPRVISEQSKYIFFKINDFSPEPSKCVYLDSANLIRLLQCT